MKKRNLILSIICSICLVIALVTLTIVSVIPAKPDDSNPKPSEVVNIPGNNDDDESNLNVGNTKGAYFDPYYISDAESFINLVSTYGGDLMPAYEAQTQIVLNELAITAEDYSNFEGEIFGSDRVALDNDEVYTLKTSTGSLVYLKTVEKATLTVEDLDKIEDGVYDEEGNALESSDVIYIVDENGEYVYTYVYKPIEITKTTDLSEALAEIYDENKNLISSDEVLTVYSANEVAYIGNVLEDGSYETEYVVDENGKIVYEKVSEEATEVPYFELVKDIDFSDVDYAPLFNNGKNFIGVINGNGYSLSNISIHVTTENLASYTYTAADEWGANLYYSHIGIFGNTDGAVISNLSVENLSIEVDNDVYSYIREADFYNSDGHCSFNELTVGSIAAVAYNTTIEDVNLSANINAEAYGLGTEDTMQGINAVGGVMGYANNSVVSGGSINVSLVSDSNSRNYFFGGVMGYARNSTIENINSVNVTVSANALSALEEDSYAYNIIYIGGLVGQMISSNIDSVKVNLSVSQVEDARYSVSGVTSIDESLFNYVAGITVHVKDTDKDVKSTISNVEVNADVDMDCIYAGAVYMVENNARGEADAVSITDVIVTSNVNTLEAFAFAAKLVNVDLNLNKYAYDSEGFEYNVKLTGAVRLAKYSDGNGRLVVASAFVIDLDETNLADTNIKSIKVVVSSNIYLNLELIDTLRISLRFGDAKRV